MKASVYIATSLDGFIARPDGSIDWLNTGESEEPGEDYGYQKFFDSVDCLVMGRNTYELVRGFDAWPYGEKWVVVLSSRSLQIPKTIAGTVESMSGTPEEVTHHLAQRGATHLYVDGGKTIQGFLAAGLIEELTITTIPILIGNGIPLFGPLPHDIPLRHVETRAFANGLVQSTYEVEAVTGSQRSVIDDR